MNYALRIEALQQQLQRATLDAYVLINVEGSERANVCYLSGFRGTFATIIVTQDRALFLTDSRYFERVKDALDPFEVCLVKQEADMLQRVKDLDAQRVGINANTLSVSRFNKLQNALEGVDVVAAEDLTASLRERKDAEEIERITRAQRLTDQTFAHILERLKPGMSEAEVAWDMETFMRQNGSDGLAFPIMVASGPHSALPHHETGQRLIQPHEFVLFDFGAKWEGYCADMTRTVCVGKPSEEQTKVYHTVLEAQQAALDAIHAGAQGQEVDRAARSLIEGAGYGDRFGHGTGHGVGLDVHEGPRLSPLAKSTLEHNAVVTVEPGIYVPGWGGVRIEDFGVVTPEGIDNLTRSPKHLIVV